MNPADDVIEIRPVQPAGRIGPDVSSMLRNWRLRAISRDGTLRLAEDRALYRQPIERVFALPSTGHADAVTGICLVTFEFSQNFPAPRTYVSWRMLLLDRQGHMVGAGRMRDEPKARELWPAEVFTPLKQLGIRVATEWYASPRALECVHPGAVPKFMLWSWPKKALIGFTGALVLLLIMGTAVYLATH